MGEPEEYSVKVLEVLDDFPDVFVCIALAHVDVVFVDTYSLEEPFFAIEKDVVSFHPDFLNPMRSERVSPS